MKEIRHTLRYAAPQRSGFAIGVILLVLAMIIAIIWVIIHGGSERDILPYASTSTTAPTAPAPAEASARYIADSSRARQLLTVADPTKPTVLVGVAGMQITPLDAGTFHGTLPLTGEYRCVLKRGGVLTELAPDHAGMMLVSYAPPAWRLQKIGWQLPSCQGDELTFIAYQDLHRLAAAA